MTGKARVLGIMGASGFLGGELARQAAAAGWRVVGFSRTARLAGDGVAEWRISGGGLELKGLDALVNLAGEPIDQRWTEQKRRQFRESRVGFTEQLVTAIEGMAQGERPEVLLNGSAVGIYGDRGDEVLVEEAPVGTGYLAELCVDWELAAEKAKGLGVRVLTWRTGVVLGKGGAAWDKMRRVFALGAGGRFGDGRQWMPWIHVTDLAGGILFALAGGMSGPVNGTAPEPERNGDFTGKLAGALGRPAFFHAPGWALRLGLGEFSGALLASQRAVPEALLRAGYPFRYPTLEEALRELVGEG